MPDILLNRETVILTTTSDGLFPRNDLYPSDDLFPSGEVREITNIVAGSLKLDSLLAERSIQFGQFYATKFEVQVYNEIDLSGRYIHVYQREGNVYHDIFSGIVDSCIVDKVGTDRTLVAYDRAYSIRQLNVADFWNGYWTIEGQTATLGEIRNALLNYYDIAHEEVTLPNDSLTFGKTVEFTSCSFQQFLSCICELNCCLPHFNGNGYLEFIVFDTEAEPIDLTGKYEWMNSDFQDYVTQPITGIQFYDSDDQLKLTYGVYDNAYPIKKNIFLYDADDTTLNSVASVMMNYLQDLSYTPASLKMIVGSFDIKLGDYVHTERGDFFVLQNSYSGSQFVEQTIKADGDEQSYGGTEDLDYGEIILNQKYARVSKDLSDFIVEYGKEQTAITTKIDGIFANYTSEDAVDYAPSVNSPPASTWVNPDTRASHIGELFYDTVNKKYYEWQKTSDTPTYNWIQVPSYAHNYSMVSSRFQINESAISAEVSRATTEENSIKQDNAEAFANYVGTYVPTSSNAPANSWTTDTLKKAHAGEVFYNKTTEKYYVYTLTYNQDGTVNTAQWVQTNINKRYDLVTTTSKAKMDLTSTDFTVALNTEKEERHSENAESFANYVSASSDTTSAPAITASGSGSWNTDTKKKSHAGEVYYNKTTGHYWKWTVNVNSDTGAVTSASWVDAGEVTNRYNLVTSTADSKLNLTTTSFTIDLNSEINARKDADLSATYNYSGNYVPTTSNTPASSWTTAALKKEHTGEIFYNTSNKKYYQYIAVVNTSTGAVSGSWVDIGTSNKAFDLVTKSANAKLNLTKDEFSVTLEQSERELFANYTGEVTGSLPGKPWSDADINHVGQVYYGTNNEKYYKFQLVNNVYKWVEFSDSSVPYNVVSSQIKQTTDAVELKVNKTDVVSDLNSRLRVSSDSILLETAGKLIITSGNFKVNISGDVVANNATLTSVHITSGDLEVGNEITIEGETPFYFKLDSDEKTLQWDLTGSTMHTDGSLNIHSGSVRTGSDTTYTEIASGKLHMQYDGTDVLSMIPKRYQDLSAHAYFNGVSVEAENRLYITTPMIMMNANNSTSDPNWYKTVTAVLNIGGSELQFINGILVQMH